MDFLDKLNPEQREAVLHTEGPAADSCGRRIGQDARHHLPDRVPHRQRPRRAGEVLAVTFTNKAAGEMRERVEALLGDDASGVWLSTFHSLCARLLRREAPQIGLSRDFVIYDSADQVAVVKQASARAGHRRQARAAARGAVARSARRRTGWKGLSSLRGAWNIRDEQIAKIYEPTSRRCASATPSISTTCC